MPQTCNKTHCSVGSQGLTCLPSATSRGLSRQTGRAEVLWEEYYRPHHTEYEQSEWKVGAVLTRAEYYSRMPHDRDMMERPSLPANGYWSSDQGESIWKEWWESVQQHHWWMKPAPSERDGDFCVAIWPRCRWSTEIGEDSGSITCEKRPQIVIPLGFTCATCLLLLVAATRSGGNRFKTTPPPRLRSVFGTLRLPS